MSVASQEPVQVHAHDWRLVEVEYDDAGSVGQWDCADCGAVEYR